jgi:hypothetical protein
LGFVVDQNRCISFSFVDGNYFFVGNGNYFSGKLFSGER